MLRRAFALFGLLVTLGLVVAALPAYAVRGDEDVLTTTTGPVSALTVLSAGSTKAVLTTVDEGPAIYIVQLADAPVASYHGGVAGLRGTSSAATGRAKIDPNSAASVAYTRYLDTRAAQTLSEVERIVGERVQPAQRYRYALNGFAATLTPAQAVAVAALPNVLRVQRDGLGNLDTDVGPRFIGAAQEDLKPTLFQAALAPSQEVAPPTGTTAATKGSATVSYDAATKTISYRVSYAGLTGPATMAHIHIAPSGSNGGVVINIFDTAVGTPAAGGVFVGSKVIADVGGGVNKTAAEIEAALFSSGLYFNIHTTTNPGGEIRGQISPARGEGIIIGVLDSGINITNPSFAEVGGDGYTHSNPLPKRLGVCDPANPRYIADFPCNNKVIGAYSYSVDGTIPDPQGGPSPYDDDGHGSHTASTAGGNVVTSSSVNGVSTGALSGVAPHANLIIYDVCGVKVGTTTTSDCPISAIIAAVDQATADGVDVFNRSISAGGGDSWADSDALAALGAFGAGVLPVGSAGNSGPDPETIEGAVHNAPWTVSVAASTHDRSFINSVGAFAGGSAGTRPAAALVGKGISGALGLTDILYAGAPAIDNALCGPFDDAQKALVTGKIVVCDRGGNGRVEKAENVADAGGAGYVLANNAASGDSLSGDAFPLPGVHISFDDGVALKAWLSGCADCKASISGTTRDIKPSYGDVMASFSSRGPNALATGLLKPDLAAPGVDILAAGVNADLAAADYEFLSGTSMASPHVAGAVALLRQLHPDWTPAEVKSALMTTAVTALRKEDGTTPADPFDYGAGRVNVARAAFAGLVLDVTGAEMENADPFLGGNPAALNLPSMADDTCITTCSFTRTLRSTLDVPVTWGAAGNGNAAVAVTVQPTSFTIAPGATQLITITADVSGGTIGEYAFGSVTLTAQDNLAPAANLPLAVQPVASDLPERITINARSLTGSYVLPVRAIAVTDLVTTTYGLVRTTPEALTLAADPTPDQLFDGAGVVTRTVTLPVGTTRYHVRTENSSAPDLDLFVYADGLVDPPDGELQDDELICVSATSSNEEWCDITLTNGAALTAPLTLQVVLQNYEGSNAATDSFDLYSGVVGTTAAGNLTVGGPETSPSGASFNLTFTYNVTGAKKEDIYIGLLRVASAPATPVNLGYTLVDVVFDPYNQYLPLIRR